MGHPARTHHDHTLRAHSVHSGAGAARILSVSDRPQYDTSPVRVHERQHIPPSLQDQGDYFIPNRLFEGGPLTAVADHFDHDVRVPLWLRLPRTRRLLDICAGKVVQTAPGHGTPRHTVPQKVPAVEIHDRAGRDRRCRIVHLIPSAAAGEVTQDAVVEHLWPVAPGDQFAL